MIDEGTMATVHDAGAPCSSPVSGRGVEATSDAAPIACRFGVKKVLVGWMQKPFRNRNCRQTHESALGSFVANGPAAMRRPGYRQLGMLLGGGDVSSA